MSAVVAQMRRAIGDEGANVTLARNLLAPVTPRLSSSGGCGGGDLHRRCVVFDCATTRARVDDVCAALARATTPGGGGGGGIEAIALCEHMAAAVVVFTTPAGAESALWGPARGSCHRVVLPLELGAEMPAVIHPTDVKIMSDSRIPVATGCGTPVTGGAWTPQPQPPEGSAWMEFRRDPSASLRGTKRFRLPSESVWMHDDMIAVDQRGMRMEHGDSIGVRPPPEKRRTAMTPPFGLGPSSSAMHADYT
ncbi:unnamed protein product [Urochloa humidicola]